jgi:heme exporter protein CcmD
MLDLDMRPYEIFVWGSYALSALGILGLIFHTQLNAKAAKTELLTAQSLWIAHQARTIDKETKDET